MYFHAPAHLGEPAPQLQVGPGPFPNIRQKMPALFSQAIAAQNALQNMSPFKESFSLLQAATGNATLALNQADQVVIIPDENATANLLGPKLVQAVLKQTGKTALKYVLGEEFGRALSVLDLFFKVKAALEMANSRDLVNNQRGSRRDDAKRYKLRFFCALYARRVSPTLPPAEAAWNLEDAYNRYEQALSNLWKFEGIERNLSAGANPYQREAPTMRAR
jgi:hypothetical protein